jgi:hypothetical protein
MPENGLSVLSSLVVWPEAAPLTEILALVPVAITLVDVLDLVAPAAPVSAEPTG